jgi:hypothetical protein
VLLSSIENGEDRVAARSKCGAAGGIMQNEADSLYAFKALNRPGW